MKNHYLIKTLGILFIAGLTLTGCKRECPTSYPFHLDFYAEEYRPLNFVENDTLTGLAPDLLREFCQNLHIPFEVSVLPWSEAYRRTREESTGVLLSIILNTERKDQFKWAGPIASVDWVLYQNPLNHPAVTSLEEARAVAKIGVVKGYAIEDFLLEQGFTNLVYCSDQTNGFEQLLDGEIDLFPASRITAGEILLSIGKSIYSVKETIPLLTDLVYFAFNLSVPDEVVADFQTQIDIIKANGLLQNLTYRYLNRGDFPHQLMLYTEQYPPLTYRNTQGEISGFGTDLVKEILRRNQEFYPITLTSWSNGYQLALNHPNVCLFTMDRTDLRESLFQWVGPIGTNTTWFYTRSGSGINLASLDDARKLSAIGTIDSWFSAQYLKELGFNNLVSASDPGVMVGKLFSGEVDAFVVTDVTFPDILRDNGHTWEEVTPALSLMSSDYYIAFSKNTPTGTVTKWQAKLESMKSDGTYDAIKKKWLPMN